MQRLFARIDGFFFRPIPATGFGLLRIMWGATTIAWMLMQWRDVANFYSADGVIPPEFEHLVLRGDYRFTIFDWVTDPSAVYAVYALFLGLAFCAMIGLWPRVTTILTVLLYFSFHERNPYPFGGGETLLRNLGFLLAVAPCLTAVSVQRLGRQWEHWKTHRRLLPAQMMPIWGYRLLLWQFLMIYGTSVWFKLSGSMWRSGTAIAAALHHPYFSRMPMWVMDFLAPFTPAVAYALMAWHLCWLLMLIPEPVRRRFPKVLRPLPLKRSLLVGGLFFHGSIFLLMDAGSFSISIFSGYLGLLLAEDFDAIRNFCNRAFRGPIAVLFDGRCGLCLKSVFWLEILDVLKRLTFADFRDAAVRRKVAPELREADLDRAMHIKLPGGRTEKSFDAFRALARHLPPLWPLLPLLWIPGIDIIGRRVYARIAENRSRCAHGECAT